MVQRPPYQGLKRHLVIAFDVGTTYSGASYCILDPGESPKIHGVNRYPAQEHVGGDSKIPSILYYDADGNVAAVGAEALLDSVIEKAEDNDWTKVEWFKLHLRPASSRPGPGAVEDDWDEINQDDEIPSLPYNKSITQVLADFLRYMFKCTREYITQSHANGETMWPTLEDSIHFILSHPNGWEGAQQALMRRAAVSAGLVPDTAEGHSRIEFVTEGEASLHYCIASDLASDVIKSGAGVIIVDAGGGTVDLSTYAMTAPNSYQEIALADCIFQGSVYVTRRCRTHLEDKLRKAKSEYAAEDFMRTIIDNFDKTTKLTVREGEPSFIKFGTPKDKDSSVNIKGGKLKMEGDEIAALFEPAIQGIIKSIENQRLQASTHVAAVFLVGGFAASNLLFGKLQNHFKDDDDLSLSRPDSHTNKAVADGALSYHIDHFVSTRMSKLTYGAPCGTPYQPGNAAHEQRIGEKYQNADGRFFIGGYFETVLPMGTSVSETKEFRRSFYDAGPRDAGNLLTTQIMCYRGDRDNAPVWRDEDPNNFQILCTIEADTSQLIDIIKPRYGPLGVYYRRDYDIVLSLGLTELKAQLCWLENGVEKRSPATVVYDID